MSKPEKTLLILTPGFPSSESDTVCLPMQQNFVLALKKNNPDLNIIILSFQYPYWKKNYQWHDITVISFNGRNKGSFSKFLLRQKLDKTLKEICATNNVIGLLSFWYNECALVGKRFADKHEIKHYSWILGQDAKQTNKYPKQLKPKPDELIALSDFLQDEFEKNHGVRPANVITPGVNMNQFNHETKGKSIDILGTGSLTPLKQYEIFIEIIAEVKKNLPFIKAGLVGNGPEKDRLQKLIDKYDLQSTITMTGELPYPEVLELMQKTKVFLHPSSYEGFSGVCQEALYAEAQVISFVTPMKKEIKNWHLVNNKEEMIKKTIELLSTVPIYERTYLFTIEDTAKKMMELFNLTPIPLQRRGAW